MPTQSVSPELFAFKWRTKEDTMIHLSDKQYISAETGLVSISFKLQRAFIRNSCIVAFLTIILGTAPSIAKYPIVQTTFTADPAPMSTNIGHTGNDQNATVSRSCIHRKKFSTGTYKSTKSLFNLRDRIIRPVHTADNLRNQTYGIFIFRENTIPVLTVHLHEDAP